jgi:hypothetical protein
MSSPDRIIQEGVGINQVNIEELHASANSLLVSRMKVRRKYSPESSNCGSVFHHISPCTLDIPTHLRRKNTTPLIYPIETSCCSFKRKGAAPTRMCPLSASSPSSRMRLLTEYAARAPRGAGGVMEHSREVHVCAFLH